MKKLFIIFSLFIFALGTQAQDITLDYDQTYLLYDGISTDVINTTDSTWTYEVWKKSDAPVKVFVDIKIDSTGGTANNVYVRLQNKRFVDGTYANISSVLWSVTSSDTTIAISPSAELLTFNSDSTITTTSSDQLNLGGYFRILVEGQDNTLLAKISRLNWMFLKE